MKVKCIDNMGDPNLTINKNYIVYAGEFNVKDGVKEYTLFKIQDDYGSIIPYNSGRFSISSNNNNNYIDKKVEKNKYEFNYKTIDYWEFWSMLYDEAGNSLEDFRVAKSELYISELREEEILCRLNSDGVDERDFVVDLLIEQRNNRFIEEVIKVCKINLEKWKDNYDLNILFKYLSIFKNDEVNQFFIEYLSESEKGNEELDNIVYKYFED